MQEMSLKTQALVLVSLSVMLLSSTTLITLVMAKPLASLPVQPTLSMIS